MKIKIEHGTILTLNKNNDVIEDGTLCIEDGKIISVSAGMNSGFIPDKVIDAKECIIMPGVVNAHCHSPMTMFRNFAGGLPLQNWMFKNIRPLQKYVTKKEIECCAKLAYAEMIKNGITAFAEMYAWADVLSEFTVESGLKALIAGSYGKDQGLEGTIGREEFLEHSQKILTESQGRVKEGVLLHSLYAVPEDIIRKTVELASETSVILQIHVSETKQEMEECKRKYHQTPVRKLEELGVFDVPVIASHCVYLEKNDIEILRCHNVSVAHCPVSNLKLGSGIADIYQLKELGVNVCLGTDGVASNNNLNLLKEANIASLLAKGIHCDPTLITSEDILRSATENGYKALGIKNSGQLKAGMDADIIMLSMKEPHFTPLTNIYDAIIYAAQASDVVMTMVNGNILMEDRELKTLDEEKILFEAKEASERILKHSAIK